MKTINGWRLVPVEVTEAMTETGVGARQAVDLGVWAAMLAAAPDPLQDNALNEMVLLQLLTLLDWSEDAQEWTLLEGQTPDDLARAVIALFRGAPSATFAAASIPALPVPEGGEVTEDDLSPVAAMSKSGIEAELHELAAKWDSMDREGSGSPGEWIIERIGELETEFQRRVARGRP